MDYACMWNIDSNSISNDTNVVQSHEAQQNYAFSTIFSMNLSKWYSKHSCMYDLTWILILSSSKHAIKPHNLIIQGCMSQMTTNSTCLTWYKLKYEDS